MQRDENLRRIYYSPQGYWRGLAAIPKVAQAASVSEKEARDLKKKTSRLANLFTCSKKYCPTALYRNNAVHKVALLYLPHDRISPKKLYKYALTVVDVASRFKAAEPLTESSAAAFAVALQVNVGL